MFILKPQDVEISSIEHPKREQQIPILTYQGQTFRLISVFGGNQEEEARAFWREQMSNHHKVCVLLEEPDRYSVWGKIRLKQLVTEASSDSKVLLYTQACLLLLQAVYLDVEDLLGSRQAGLFQQDITNVFRQSQFPQSNSPEAINHLLTQDPLTTRQVPPWKEHHLITLLQELYRLGKVYFGNSNFASGVSDMLQNMPSSDKVQFMEWLQSSPPGQLWR